MTNVFLFANNASTTLAGAISPTDTTILLAPGTGSRFPNPITGQQFAMTFTDAATGLLNEIVYCTARTGDTLTVIRAQEATAGQSWNAGDIAANLVTAGSLQVLLQQGGARIRLLANTSFYVTTTGNDTTGDGTSGNPWATPQHASNVIQNAYDLAGFQATVQIAAGTYTGSILVAGPYIGATALNSVVFNGVGTTTIMSGVDPIEGSDGAQFAIQNMKVLFTDRGVIATHDAGVGIGTGTYLQSSGGSFHIDSGGTGQGGGIIRALGNFSIQGNSNAWLAVAGSSEVAINNVVVTVVGTPAWSNAGVFSQFGYAEIISTTFVGGATGHIYSSTYNGVISTGGAFASLPGSTSGLTSNGGQVL